MVAVGVFTSWTVTRCWASWRRRSASSVHVVRKPQGVAPAFVHAYSFAMICFSLCARVYRCVREGCPLEAGPPWVTFAHRARRGPTQPRLKLTTPFARSSDARHRQETHRRTPQEHRISFAKLLDYLPPLPTNLEAFCTGEGHFATHLGAPGAPAAPRTGTRGPRRGARRCSGSAPTPGPPGPGPARPRAAPAACRPCPPGPRRRRPGPGSRSARP